MRLTDYFIKKKVQSLAAGAAGRKHESRALDEVTRILVLYQAEDRELLAPCLNLLRKKNKQVLECVYLSGNPLPKSDIASLSVSRKDLNIWQIPSDSLLEQFKAIHADMLMDLTHPDCYPMQYLMLQHPCGFKVGVKHPDVDLYDLSISVASREDMKQLFEHILFYLQAIRSK